MNKTILVVLILCFGSAKNFAQKLGEHDITKPYAEIEYSNGDVLQIKKAPQHVGKVQGTIGADYTSSEIFALPTRSINKISGLTMGVNFYGGQEPVFKGTTGGTAYFVDGIRVRSALGIAGFIY
jgi:hypothetical protein